MRPLIECLGGTPLDADVDLPCGRRWGIAPHIGSGTYWYLPINGIAAVSALSVRAAQPISLETATADLSTFGMFARHAAPDAPAGGAAHECEGRGSLLGYAWRKGALRCSLQAGEALQTTCIHLLPQALATIGSALDTQPAELTSAISLLDGTKHLPRLVHLFEELRSPQLVPGCMEGYFRCKIVEGCIHLVDWYRKTAVCCAPHMSAEDMTSLNVARRWARGHLHEPICLDDLCRVACVSATKLTALFKELDGETPMEWVRNRRMERACELLATTDLLLGDISRHVGFAKHGSFSTAFRARFGMTPNRFRTLHRRDRGTDRLSGVLLDA